MSVGAAACPDRIPAPVKVTGACQIQQICEIPRLRGGLLGPQSSHLPQGRLRYQNPCFAAPLFCQAITSTNVAQVA